MKRNIPKFVLTLLLVGMLLPILSGGVASAQSVDWYDPGWDFRRPVEIPHPCGIGELTDFQVQVTLDDSFDFSQALPDGNDLRVTDSDGMTPIPFWIEEWDSPGMTASIWIKVPSIPLAGTTIYLYYGNPSPPGPPIPDLVEVPPIGPWDDHADNPIVPIGDPGGGSGLLAENIIYDDVTGHYWLVFAVYRGGSSVGLAWSDDPADPTAWNWQGIVITSANAPHLIEHGGIWYIFYADKANFGGSPYPSSRPISVATSASVGGPYTYAATVLTSTLPWEAARVDEPYVFQRNDGKWILVYMGDAGGTTELIGYASADDIMGPYTKFAGNPCIDFGPPGSIDAGTVADPWVVEFYGTYYIGYTVSSTKSSPWRTSYVTTDDWITFTKSNEIILDLGPPGAWDERDAFRGAVTRFGDTYYFPYTGKYASGSPSGYIMGIATQPAFMPEVPPPINDPDSVFEFFDCFEDEDLDTSKWTVIYTGTGHTTEVSGGILTITAQAGGYVRMWGSTYIGTGTLLEARARNLDAGLNPGSVETNTAGEIGYSGSNFNNIIRVMDYPDLQKYTIQAAAGGVTSGYTDTLVDFDTAWHTYRIFRTATGTAEFQIDENTPQSLGSPYVPTIGLRPWLMSYARNPALQNQFQVDCIRVRKYCGADPVVELGEEEYPNQPPVADAGPDQTVEQTSHAGTSVTLDGSGSYDPDKDPLSYVWSASGIIFDDPTSPTPTATFLLGRTTVTLIVNDGCVDSDLDMVDITVEDTTPPDISVSIIPDTLWPPNHKMVVVTATVTVSDICDSNPSVVLTSVVSDEPDDAKGNGDGKTVDDIQDADIGFEDYEFQLRAERAGSGDGRTYTITYTVTDASGNSATAIAEVIVPHDQGKGKK